jgi:hypothetical protein
LAIEIPAPKTIIKSPSSEKDLNSKSKSQQGALVAKPIDLETATVFELKPIIYGIIYSFQLQFVL